MSYISKKIYTLWTYVIAVSTPLVGVYAVYDIIQMVFNEERKKKYTRKYTNSRPLELDLPEIKDKQKNGQFPFVIARPNCLNNQKIISIWTVTEENVYARIGCQTEFGKIIPKVNHFTDVKWTKNDISIKSTHPTRTKFKIYNVSLEDEGIYVCTIEPNKIKLKYCVRVTDFSRKEITHCWTDLSLKVIEIWAGILETVYAVEGGTTQLGEPFLNSFDVRWTKSGQQFQSVNSVLEIYNVSFEDEGIYVCMFGQANAQKQKKFRLIVLETVETVCAEEGCQISLGIPKEDVDNLEWTKDGEAIKSTHPKRTWLRLSIKSKLDGGLYVCTFGPTNMKLKYRVVVADRIREVSRNKTIDPMGFFRPIIPWRDDYHKFKDSFFANRRVKKVTIKCEGWYENMKGVQISLGPDGLILECSLSSHLGTITNLRYIKEKFKEDRYRHFYTELGIIHHPHGENAESYFIVRLVKN